MKALLDTHTFLWWITDNPKLSLPVRGIITNGKNELFLSAASGWEIAIKSQMKRLRLHLPNGLEGFISDHLAINSIENLSIGMRHALHIYTLPNHHHDPFDRIIVAQAMLENLPILTADPQIALYDVEIIW